MRRPLHAEKQDQHVEPDRRENALRVALSLNGSVCDRRVLLVGEAEGQWHDVSLVVRRGAEADLGVDRRLGVQVGRHARDGEESGGLAVARANDQLEGLLVVGVADDLVVEPSPTHDRTGPEGRPGTQESAAAGKPEGCGSRNVHGGDPSPWLERALTDPSHDVQGGGVGAFGDAAIETSPAERRVTTSRDSQREDRWHSASIRRLARTLRSAPTPAPFAEAPQGIDRVALENARLAACEDRRAGAGYSHLRREKFAVRPARKTLANGSSTPLPGMLRFWN